MSLVSNQSINLVGYSDQPIIIQHISTKRNLDVKFIIEQFNSIDGRAVRGNEQDYYSDMFESFTGEVVKYIGVIDNPTVGQYLGYILVDDKECGKEVFPLSISILQRELDTLSSECISYKTMLDTLYRQLMMFKHKLEPNGVECYKAYNINDIIIPFYEIDTTRLKLSNHCNSGECGSNKVFATNATVVKLDNCNNEGFYIGSYPMMVTDDYGKSNNINISDKQSSYIVFEKGDLPEGRYQIFGEVLFNNKKIHTDSIFLTIDSNGNSNLN